MLGDDGYTDQVIDDLITEMGTTAQNYMGSNLDVSEYSLFGQLIRAFAQEFIEVDERTHDAYDANFTDTSTGVSLDRHASNVEIQRYQAQASEVTLQITGTPGYVVPEDTEFLTESETAFQNSEDVQIGDDGTATLTCYSEDTADYTNVDANTITIQANPVDEITNVTNPEAAHGGADLETDYHLRQRIHANDISKESPTLNGLRTGMLNVIGVTDAYISQNITSQTNAMGDPAWSVHVFAKGGRPDQIAQKLLDIGGADTTFVGSKSNVAVDKSGHEHMINFDYVRDLETYLTVTIKTTGIVDPDAIKQSIMDYINNVGMGNPIEFTRIYGYIYDNDNVGSISDLKIGTDQNNMQNSDILVEPYQEADITEDNIKVVTTDA